MLTKTNQHYHRTWYGLVSLTNRHFVQVKLFWGTPSPQTYWQMIWKYASANRYFNPSVHIAGVVI